MDLSESLDEQSLQSLVSFMYSLFHIQVDLSESLDEQSLQSLVSFMYTGELLVSESTVQDLMASASFLAMHNVLEFCADFLKVRFISLVWLELETIICIGLK